MASNYSFDKESIRFSARPQDKYLDLSTVDAGELLSEVHIYLIRIVQSDAYKMVTLVNPKDPLGNPEECKLQLEQLKVACNEIFEANTDLGNISKEIRAGTEFNNCLKKAVLTDRTASKLSSVAKDKLVTDGFSDDEVCQTVFPYLVNLLLVSQEEFPKMICDVISSVPGLIEAPYDLDNMTLGSKFASFVLSASLRSRPSWPDTWKARIETTEAVETNSASVESFVPFRSILTELISIRDALPAELLTEIFAAARAIIAANAREITYTVWALDLISRLHTIQAEILRFVKPFNRAHPGFAVAVTQIIRTRRLFADDGSEELDDEFGQLVCLPLQQSGH